YGYRTALLTANATIAQGTYTYTVTATDNAANTTTSANQNVIVDNTAPSITAATIAPTSGATSGGYIRQGGTFYVYASVSDAGGSSIAAVTADVSSVATGQTAVAMTAGSYPFGGVTYTYRSAALTANATIAPAAYSYTITASDNATNAATPSYSLTVDNTVPTVGTINIAPTAGAVDGGYIKQGGTFYVYANASDTGGAAISTVTANVSSVATGQTAVTLVAGSYTFDGLSYGYRSASITANGTIASGAYTYTLTATDNAANSTTSAAQTVNVDNTAPSIGATTIDDSGSGTAGTLDAGETFYVYANVSDAGGVDTVTANVSSVATGQTAAVLTPGSYTADGVPYDHRSALLTADSTLAPGSYTYTVTARDRANNSTTTPPQTVTVIDNTTS
ncbi:MAG: hypothetical protein LC708_03265, partial [Actinobacteria bacterium]|nr:hypothetical protein [Actinomycetota bacterium]